MAIAAKPPVDGSTERRMAHPEDLLPSLHCGEEKPLKNL